jgi:hypothetical protein
MEKPTTEQKPMTQDDVLAQMHEEFILDCQLTGVDPTLMAQYGYIN